LPRNPAKDRIAFLKELYEKSGGNEYKWFDFRALGKDIGLDEDTAFNVANYLSNEGLLKWQALGGILGITHLGIKLSEERKSRWNRLKLNRRASWLTLVAASWVVTTILDRGTPLLINAIVAVISAASSTQVSAIPAWEYQLIAFIIAIPILYISYGTVLGGPQGKTTRFNKLAFIWGFSLAFLGIFVLGFLANTLFGH